MSAVSVTRKQLADDLRLRLGGVVVPYSDAVTVNDPTVMVRVGQVGKGVVRGLRVVTLEVLVIGPRTEPGPADDDLDALLERTLDALDLIDQVVWTGAERGVFETTYPAYVITCTRED